MTLPPHRTNGKGGILKGNLTLAVALLLLAIHPLSGITLCDLMLDIVLIFYRRRTSEQPARNDLVLRTRANAHA